MSSHHSKHGVARARSRRALQTAVAVALVGGVVASGGTPASAAPERVLQSVAITLGSDSSITGVNTTAVRAGEGDELSSDSATMDPSAAAEELPVRVLTSWRLGERTGTDLADIEGEEGRVVIDVTVQNVTARPEVISYAVNGTERQQNALVATPMTVVASADLGDDSLGTVVTRDDVNPEDVTNGVLGRTGEQGADVQWASLLAPPRLGASATFRLVQDTEKFTVPTFDLSVQPGLVTDPSVQRLLEAAFSDDPSSTLALETSTIELVSGVNSILTGASSVLGQIQSELGASAADLGRKTIADLESSSALVSTSLTSLARDLDSLSGQMSQEMETANAETVAQFRDTVESMKSLLGDPKAFDRLPAVDDARCDQPIPGVNSKGSITQQMIAITSQLRMIEDATADCREVITQGLNEAIGTEQDDEFDDSVIGSLRSTQAALLGEAGELRQAGSQLANDFDGDLLGYLSTSVGSLGGLVETIQDLADELNDVGGGGPVTFQLRQVQNTLGTMQTELDEGFPTLGGGRIDGLGTILGQIETEAGTALGANGEAAAQVATAAASLCDLQPDDPADAEFATYDEISTTLVGTTCDGTAVEGATPVVAKLTTAGTALAAIQGLTDDGQVAFARLSGQVEDAKDIVDRILERDGDDNDIDELLEAIASLSDGRDPFFGAGEPRWPTLGFIADPAVNDNAIEQCRAVQDFDLPARITDPELQPGGYTYPDPLEQLRLFHKKMECNQIGIEQRIDEAFVAGADILDATRGSLDDHVGDIDDARGEATDDVDTLVGTLTGALDDSVGTIRANGKRAITQQREALDRSRENLSDSLDQRVAEAVRRIDATVGDSTDNLEASERALLADLDEVLLDLGTRDESGSGLLGALSKGAADTGTATDSVIRANQATAEFAGVRRTALDDVFLQQAQLERSLELLESYPAFGEDGEDAADGSSHLTVFSFSMGAN